MLPFAHFSSKVLTIQSNIVAACQRAKRDPLSVKVMAVCKNQTFEAWQYTLKAGLFAVGENRVQESLKKHECTSYPRPRLEFIGHLQTNKVKKALSLFDRIQSVDSIQLLKALNNKVIDLNKAPFPILLEINTGNDPAKTAASIQEAPYLLEFALSHCPALRVEGLMTIAPRHQDSEPSFLGLYTLRNELETSFHYPLPELSMGMSQDFPIAIAQGSTLIRIGSALFQA